MANTTRRESVTFSVPDTPDYKHLNITTFAGIQESDNPFITQNNTASSSLNVYVDEFNALTTRPRVQKKYNTTHNNVTKVFDSKNGGLLFKVPMNGSYNTSVFTKNGTVVNNSAYYHEDLYETNNKTYFFPDFSVLDWSVETPNTTTIYNNSSAHIPIRYVKHYLGMTEDEFNNSKLPDVEELNVLTNQYKELWFWDFESDVPEMLGYDYEAITNKYVKQEQIDIGWSGYNSVSLCVLKDDYYDKNSFHHNDFYYYDLLEATPYSVDFVSGVGYRNNILQFETPYARAPIIACDADGSTIVICDADGNVSYTVKGSELTNITETTALTYEYQCDSTLPISVNNNGDLVLVACLSSSTGNGVNIRGLMRFTIDYTGNYTKTGQIYSGQIMYGFKHKKSTAVGTPDINNVNCVCLSANYDDSYNEQKFFWIITDLDNSFRIDCDYVKSSVELSQNKDILVYKKTGDSYNVYYRDNCFVEPSTVDAEKQIKTHPYNITNFCFNSDDTKIFCLRNDKLVGHINIETNTFISYGRVEDWVASDNPLTENRTTNYVFKNNKILKTQTARTSYEDDYQFLRFYFDGAESPKIEIIKNITNFDDEYELWKMLRLDLIENARNPFLFDNRVWLSSGNRVFWSSGPDPTYYKITDYNDVGSSTEDVTGFNLYNDSTMLIYKKKNIYVVSPLNTDYGLTYSFSETRNENGNEAPFAPTITPITNFPIHVNDDGVYVMRQTQNVLTDDSTTTLISSNIDRLWKKENNIQNISTINHKYWTLFFKPDVDNKQTRIFVLDNRNNSWFYWEIENLVVNNITNGNKGLLMWDNQGNGYSFETSDIINVYTGRPEYYDLDYKIIKWHWTSQILHLGTLNYNKKLAWTNFIVSDTDANEDYALNYKYYVYMDKQNVSNQMTTHGTLNYIKSNVLKTRLPRFDFLQIKLYNVDELLQESDNTTISPEQNNKLRLIGLGFKYQLLEAKFK